MPFTSLGITPEGAASVLLPLFVGRVKASDLLLCGSRISAEEALSLGLVNAVVDDSDELCATVHDRARLLASLPSEAMQRTKRLLKEGLESLVTRQFAAEQESMHATVTSTAAKQAFARFLKKR
jgi:enoyl-CoA hydratase/carnithine racemase